MNDERFPPPHERQVNAQIPNFGPKHIAGFAGVLLLIVAIWSSMYKVEVAETGVVLRFGAFHSTKPSGLNFKLPFGIDRVYFVETERQQKLEFGFGKEAPSRSRSSGWAPRSESAKIKTMVTGDLNAATVEWIIQYRVDDPQAFLFNVRNPVETLRDSSESVMREVVGDRTVDEVLTIGRQDIEIETLSKLQELTTKYGMGIRIDQVQLKNVNPPKPVQASFDDVNRAKQERESRINEADGQYNREVPKARGVADQQISEAEGYATQRINEAEGDAARFSSLFLEYQKAPDVTKRRMYLETLGDVIPSLGNKIIIDDQMKQILPLMNLNSAKGVSK